MLSSLLHQILIFVQRHANYDFVKSLCTKDQVKWQIEAYHARIGVLVNAFQVGVRLVSLDIRRPKGDYRYQNCSISITGSCKMKQRERRIRRLCINDSTNCRRITAILLGFWVRLVDNMSFFFRRQIYSSRSDAQQCSGDERFSSEASQRFDHWREGARVSFP
jgi:hypothetical protein